MLISQAYAQATDKIDEISALADAPTASEQILTNLGLVIALVALFYVLLILPQQRRFKEHSDMLSDLKKGDRVVTAGGLVGVITKIVNDQEVILDLGNGIEVTALRSMIQGKTEIKPKAAANDVKAAPKKKEDKSASDKPASKPKKKKEDKE